MKFIRERPDLMAVLTPCLDDSDIEISFIAKQNTIHIVALNYKDNTATEVFRQVIVPVGEDNVFAFPETDRVGA